VVVDPPPRDPLADDLAMSRAAPAGAMEAMVLAPDVLPDAPVLTFAMPAPLTLPLDGTVEAALGGLDLPVEVVNRAVPRRDAFAYLVAEVADGPTQTLLPGRVELFRNATLVGETFLPLVPAGAEFELPFGPRRDLPLEYVALENETGETGFLSTSGRRVQSLALRVRNLSDGAEVVEVLYPLPFSEQQALEIDVIASPPPDARDVDDLRGVARWSLPVPPGEEAEIGIRVEATWPQGRLLVWEP
jgi:uncharacterized protein (TIGR02231 family)